MLACSEGRVGGAVYIFTDDGCLCAVTYIMTFVGVMNMANDFVDAGMF